MASLDPWINLPPFFMPPGHFTTDQMYGFKINNHQLCFTTKKASGGDRIPVELFQILKDDAVEVLHSICQQIWKTQQWLQDWKRLIFILIPKKGNARECANYCTMQPFSTLAR